MARCRGGKLSGSDLELLYNNKKVCEAFKTAWPIMETRIDLAAMFGRGQKESESAQLNYALTAFDNNAWRTRLKADMESLEISFETAKGAFVRLLFETAECTGDQAEIVRKCSP
jgi:hypothetical protein